MKILAVVGSGRKAHTYAAVERFLGYLESSGPVESEIVHLAELNLEACRGCKACMDRGEEFCRLQGDVGGIMDRMMESDGVVFATPNYAFGVSGMMKVFLDRIAFVFHRPRMFGKAFTGIVVQGVFGGGRINSYLKLVGRAMGFDSVKGSCITTLEPMTEKLESRNRRTLEKHAARFLKSLEVESRPRPALFDVVMFRISRTRIRSMLNEKFRDYTWYRDKGWFESDFYYPARLGPVVRTLGRLVDLLARVPEDRRFDQATTNM